MSRGFFACFDEPGDNSVVIAHGPQSGRVTLKVCGDNLFVRIEGDPEASCLVRCMREALNAGLVHKNMKTLVDLTRFDGSVDWNALQEIRDMAPWGEGKETRVAYVIRNSIFAPLIRIVEALFTRSHHCTFANSERAIAWLVPE